jgi:hypothetical protein
LVRDDDGAVLDAEYSVVRDEGHLDLILESAGGASRDAPARNADYRSTLGVLLARLRGLKAIVDDAVVDSRYTQQAGIPAADRRLIDGPVRLRDVDDLDALRLQLTSRQTHIGQTPDARGGNSTKRIRLRLTVPGYSAGDADRLADRIANPLPVLPELSPEAYVVDGSHRRGGLTALAEPPQASVEDVLGALQGLKLQHGPDGLAKRHQPLTLLWAIGRARQRRHRLIPWPEAKAEVGQLIQDHGRATDRRNPHLPFLALSGSGLWEVTRYPPSGLTSNARLRWLNNTKPIVRGGLAEPVCKLLAESKDAAVQAVGLLLADHFDTEEWDGVLAATGLTNLASALRSSPAPLRVRRPGRSGRIADAVLRAAIEQHAVDWAMNHYRGLGYEVRDVGSIESYDVHAVSGGDELHIEVKGSISAVNYVQLTVNEVEHARQVQTELVVVDQIQWEHLADGAAIRTSGGRFRLWPNWQPADLDLRADRFRYRLLLVEATGLSSPTSQEPAQP